MPATFNVRFIINEKTQTRVLRLTDTSTGFTFSKGNISITFPDGSTRIKTDFNSADISVAGGFVDVACVLDARNNVITGEYKIDYVALDTSNVEYTATRQFDFNFVKPTNGIVNEVDVVIPEVKFSDSNSYSTNGSFTGSIIKTLSASFPVTSAASGLPAVTTTGNIIDVKNVTTVANYYEGVYNPTSDINALYTHSSNAWLTVKYDELFTKQIIVKKCPDQYTLIQKINNYRAVIDGYKELNDDRFNLLSEQYDLVIALYSHVIARYDAGLQDGSEPQLRELLSILEPYDTNYTYQSGPIGPFELTPVVGNSFNISNGSSTDSFQLGQTLSFVSGSAALQIALGNNILTWTPVFGSTAATFAQGNDARFHDQVTIGTGNGLSIANQVLSLALVTNVTAGAMSAADKVLFDAIPTTYVKYNGSIANVNLGEYGLKAGWLGFDLTPTGTPTDVGTMSWNDQDGTVDLKLKGGNVTLQVGQEQVSRIVNKTGINLLESNYQVVRIDGAQGNRLKVALAQANNDANSAETLGIVTETINDNQEGFITTSGLVRNIDTTGTLQGETWADGDMLYLSGTTAGRLTNIKPQAPTHTVIMGYVVRAHQTQGAIYVKVDNGYEINELHNVSINGVANNQALVYESATSLWKNKALFGAGGLFTTTDILEGTNLYYTQARFDSAFAAKSTTNLSEGTNLYYTQARFDSAFSAKSTTNLSEGTNLYFTNTRARQAISETITGIDYDNTTGVFSITSGYGIPTTAKQGEWDSAYNDVILTASVSGTSTKTLTLTQRDGGTITASWSDIDTNLVTSVFGRTGAVTAQSGDYTTAQVTESGNLYFTELRVRDTVLTGLNVTGGTVIATDSVLAAFGKIQNQLNTLSGATQYQGVWNASTNSPTITSSSGTKGHYYKVSVAGTTSIDGINDWEVGDWIIYNGTTWDKVDNTDKVSSVNGFTGAVSLTTSNITEGTNLYYTDTRSRAALSFVAGSGAYNSTTGVITIPTNTNQLTNGASFITLASLSAGTGISYNSTTGVISYSGTVYTDSSIRALFSAGAGISYNNTTGVITSTITQYTDAMARASLSFVAGSGAYNSTTGVITIPTNTNQLTNGASFITLASLSASAPLSYNNGTGAFSISQASSSTNGFLSSTDWNTFNNKQNALTNPITGTGTANYYSRFSETTTIGNGLISDDATNVSISGGVTSSSFYRINKNGSDSLGGGAFFALYNTAFTSAMFMQLNASNGLDWWNSGGSKLMTLTSSGNLGLGVTPSAWDSIFKSFDFSTTASLAGSSGGANLFNNAYYNGTSYIYKTTDYALRYFQGSGIHAWFTAPSGTAGTAISFTQAMTLTNGGNLLVGTTTDSGYKLNVNGTFNVSGASFFNGINSLVGSSYFKSSSTLGFIVNDSTDTYNNFISYNNGNAYVRSNLGIGTTSPAYKLDVNGSARINNLLWFTPSSGLMALGANGTNLEFYNGAGAETRLILTNTGNLGLGVTPSAWNSPFKVLQIGSTTALWSISGVTGLSNNLYNDGTGRYLTTDYATIFEHSSGQFRWLTAPSGTAGTAISFTQAMTLDASGNLMVATTSASNSAGGRGNITIGGSSTSILNFQIGGSLAAYLYHDNNNLNILNSKASGALLLSTNSTEAMRINAGGNVSIGNTNNTYKLDVSGTGFFSGTGSGSFNSQVILNNTTSSPALIAFQNTVNGHAFGFSSTGTQRFVFINGAPTEIASITLTGAATFSSSVTAVGLFSTTSAGGNLAAKIRNTVTSASGLSGYGLAIESEASAATSYALTVRNLAESTTYFHILTETGKAGNVGIGTSSPLSLLHLNGSEPTLRIVDSSDSSTTFIGSTGGYSYIRPFSRDFRILNASGVGMFTVTSGGNVGIGTTSPGSTLEVIGTISSNTSNAIAQIGAAGSGNWANSGHQFIVGGNSIAGYTGMIVYSDSTSGIGQISFADGRGANDSWRGTISYEHSNDAMTFVTNAAERMRITSQGRLLLGTSSSGSLMFEFTDGASADKYTTLTGNLRAVGRITQDLTNYRGIGFGYSSAENLGFIYGTTTGGNTSKLGFLVYNGSAWTNKMVINNNTINMDSLPTSSTGLSTGDLWKDGSGYLRIV